MKAKIILKYHDKTYEINDECNSYSDNDESDYTNEDCIYDLWTDGNYSCDCNKSLFIQRQCDKQFPLLKCGDEIKLVAIILGDDSRDQS